MKYSFLFGLGIRWKGPFELGGPEYSIFGWTWTGTHVAEVFFASSLRDPLPDERGRRFSCFLPSAVFKISLYLVYGLFLFFWISPEFIDGGCTWYTRLGECTPESPFHFCMRFGCKINLSNKSMLLVCELIFRHFKQWLIDKLSLLRQYP